MLVSLNEQMIRGLSQQENILILLKDLFELESEMKLNFSKIPMKTKQDHHEYWNRVFLENPCMLVNINSSNCETFGKGTIKQGLSSALAYFSEQ